MIEESLAQNKIWDLCLVGTGPVGMAIALECERLGIDVLILEAGETAVNPALAESSRALIVDPERHADMEIAVCRALGGTSWTWGGRCVPYDDIDFAQRDFVADAEWPLTHDEIRPWYKPAAEYLLCGSDRIDYPFLRPLSNGVTLNFVERWARESRVILEHRDRLIAAKHAHISLKTTVTGLNLNENQSHVESISVVTPGGQATVNARRIILAMGGVETTRLLLNVQQKYPNTLGGVDGPLGRFYMGHISGKIASIVFEDPKSIAELDFKLEPQPDGSAAWIRRRFMLTEQAQMEHKVLNTAFWPDNPAFYNPSHRSGVLSSVFLALAFPPSGRKLLSEAIRLAHIGPKPRPYFAHLRNAILGAPQGAMDIYRILRDRFIRKPKKPGFLVSNRGGRYALHYHAEQIPNPDSRIQLADETDASGVRRAKIDLRFTEQDVQSVIDSHEILDKALQANNIGHLEYLYEGAKLRDKVWAQAADGFHQVGTTRMGTDPETNVVDPDLRVHGLTNLHVASSSVFPTSGQANSTMLAVAFGLRLVHHLKGQGHGSGNSVSPSI
jgi:choline dehydrogenase-like flavoprotein